MDDKTIHLLLVEDNLTDVLLLEESLAEVRAPEIVVTRVERLAEALQHMEKEEYSIVLLDLELPDSNELETFIKLYQAQTKTPILVLTGLDDEKIGLRAIQEGAQDYLVKGQMSGHALARIIRYAIERKQAENLIRISEANLAQAQRIAHLGSWEMDLLPAGNLNGSTLRWSDEVFRIFGYEPGEIEVSNENFFRAVHPDDRERITATMTQAVGEGKAYRLDHRILLPGGEERIVQEQAEIVFDPDTDKPARMVGTVQDITERKQAEALLRESEDRFSGAFEHAPIGMALVSPGGQWLKVNGAVCDLLGYSEAELLALTFQDITYPEDLDLDLGNVRRMLAGEIQSYEMEKRYIHRSGHLITALLGVSLVRDDHGTPRYFISHIRDITGRKQVEDALRASQQQFQSIVANVPGMVYQFVLQPDGSVEWPFVSEGCRELYEVEPEIIQRNPLLPFEAVHPDDIAGINNSIAKSAQALLPFSWEGRLRTPSGRNKWVQYASRPQRLPNGGTLWDGLLMDITARKEAEEERDRFFTLSPDMMSIGSTDGYFKRLNPAFEVTLGYSIEELMSKHFLEFVHPDDRAVTQAQTDNLILGLRVTQFENRYRCRDGSYKWLRRMCVPFEDLIYSVAHDVTEVKKAEAALLKANDELELCVMERTAELEISNQEMYAAKQEADAANAAKSEFLSRMSHELRTPLNAILGFGQVLEMRGLSTRDSECVGHIVQGGRHLLELINEVLDIARVEAGHISLSIEPVDISQVLRETLDLVTLLGEQQGIRFDLGNSQSCQSTVRADRQRLKQVLINLLSNAVKYNRPGGSVSISCLPDGAEYTRIEVRDSGQGIAPEDLQKMFVPFERLGAESSQIEGTGLGLVLCLRLVEAMGGTLEAQSVVDEGSTFSIVLPRMDAPMPQLQTTAADTQKLSEITATTKTKTLLAIEDNPANYSLLEVILESRPNVRLVGCAQGSIGLDLARRHQPDFILLDLHLPDMEGSEVLRRLLEAPETREIPIIVVSADATPPQVERMLQAGARSYLTKPLNVAEFLRIVDEMREEDAASEEITSDNAVAVNS